MDIEIIDSYWTQLDATVTGDVYQARDGTYILAIKDDADQRLYVDLDKGCLYQPDVMYRLKHITNCKLVVEK